jgi:hypothetical protein
VQCFRPSILIKCISQQSSASGISLLGTVGIRVVSKSGVSVLRHSQNRSALHSCQAYLPIIESNLSRLSFGLSIDRFVGPRTVVRWITLSSVFQNVIAHFDPMSRGAQLSAGTSFVSGKDLVLSRNPTQSYHSCSKSLKCLGCPFIKIQVLVRQVHTSQGQCRSNFTLQFSNPSLIGEALPCCALRRFHF